MSYLNIIDDHVTTHEEKKAKKLQSYKDIVDGRERELFVAVDAETLRGKWRNFQIITSFQHTWVSGSGVISYSYRELIFRV